MNLGHVILASMKHVEATLLFVFEHSASASGLKPSQNETTTQILHRLGQARDDAREKFANLYQGMNGDMRKTDDVELAIEASDQSLFLVSLIEVRPYLSSIPMNGTNTVV